MSDKRKPVLEKVGCAFMQFDKSGFTFFSKGLQLSDGDTFIYNKGILWRVET